MARRWLVVVGPLLIAACSLTTSLDGFTGGDASVPDDAGGGFEATFPDTFVAPPAPPAQIGQPVIIASDVGVAYAAGAAQQTHLHYAKNAAEWRFFYISDADPNRLRTRVSLDFANWMEGTALPLPQEHPHDGRSFAVTYADIGGRDVFHVSISLKANSADRRHHHARAAVMDGKLLFDPITELGKVTLEESKLDPDGPAVAILADGKVLDIAGWYSQNGGTSRTGNVVAWASTANDNAAAWPSTFASPFEVEVVATLCNARALVVTNAGAMALWEGADEDPDPKVLSFARFESGSWTPSASAGFASETFDPNDWAAAALGGDVHAIRFSTSNFVHRVYANAVWAAGPGIPPRAHPIGQGVSVVSDGSSLYAISLDASGAVESTSFAAGAWTAWKTDVPAATGTRSRPAAYAGPGGVAVVWAETSGPTRDIVGARLR